jgi:CspA family cold shock protein
MATGTVKSFNRSRGYGFIRLDSGGRDVFVHLSAVQNAGLADLRKGQKISFEIFDNQGKAAAKDLRVDGTAEVAPQQKLVSIQDEVTQNARCHMKAEQPEGKRSPISRAALELALAEAVRGSDPQCEGLIGIFVERVVPGSPGGANWVVKGIRYGKAERDRCNAAISSCVEEGQREFEVSD